MKVLICIASFAIGVMFAWYLRLNMQNHYKENLTKSQKSYNHILRILRLRPDDVQKAWNYYNIEMVSDALADISYKVKVDINALYAQIYYESGFDPGIYSKRNRNGSRDIGLTQQNSYYIEGRCRQIKKRKCYHDDFKNPITSVAMMGLRLKECAKTFKEEEQIIGCYNPKSGKYYRKVKEAQAKIKQMHGEI